MKPRLSGPDRVMESSDDGPPGITDGANAHIKGGTDKPEVIKANNDATGVVDEP